MYFWAAFGQCMGGTYQINSCDTKSYYGNTFDTATNDCLSLLPPVVDTVPLNNCNVVSTLNSFAGYAKSTCLSV
jgi:hypothetical protein